MANNPETMPTIANTKAATGCQVWEKCIIVALPLTAVAIVAVVSLSMCFISREMVVRVSVCIRPLVGLISKPIRFGQLFLFVGH